MAVGGDIEGMGVDRSVSVVIPTLNEAARLPVLLACLDRQTRRALEIVVADGDSKDGTTEIARAHGARVVRGGRPAEGRNAGAAAASGDLILFMDADAQLSDEFIERAVEEFTRRGLGIATAPPRAVERGLSYRVVFPAAEAYMRLTSPIVPSAVGLCLLVDRQVHERIGGFDETLVMAEDAEYARRAARVARFGILRSVKAFTSARRISSYGWLSSARVILFTESRNLRDMPIRSVPFRYEFGAYDEAAAGGGGTAPPTPTPDGGSGAPRAGAPLRPDVPAPRPTWWRRLGRELYKPSAELQGDEVGVQVTAVAVGATATVALAALGAAPALYLSVAGIALALAVAATILAFWKDHWERPYGDFLSTSVAVPSQDYADADGQTVVRAGVGEICELHELGHIPRMRELYTQGIAGRLTVILETFEGLLGLAEDLDDPWYANVTHVVGRADFTAILFKLGFEEIPDPPRYSFYNRAEKRVLMWVIGLRIGSPRSGDSDSYRMAIVTKERFASPEMRAQFQKVVDRTRRDIARASKR